LIAERGAPNDQRAFIHKRTIGAIGGFLRGGPAGAVSGFLQPSRRSRARLPAPRQIAPTRRRRSRRSISKFSLPGMSAISGPMLAPRASSLQADVGPTGGGCPSGFHPNKSSYMTKGGFVQKFSKCVRNRRRNLSNGRANTRALRRMAAWDKQERRLGKTLKSIARGR